MAKVFGKKWHIFANGNDDENDHQVLEEASDLCKHIHDSPLILELIQQIKDTATFFTTPSDT